MADPATMTVASMGSNILGGVIKGVGSIMGGNAKSSMYKYQAGVARANAEIARRNAQYVRSVGEREAQRSGMKTRFEIGNQAVIQSGRGIDINSGSARDVRESQAEVGYHEQATIRSNAMRRAYGHEVEAVNKENEARMLGKSAQRSKLAGYIEAGGSILGSASSVASKWTEASQMGMFNSGGDAYLDNRTSDDYYYG